MDNTALENWVRQAVQGDKKALEEVVVQIQDLIYNLAIRMLWHPDEAKDATQEVLIRVITNLGSFQGQSAFTTWVYRVASNTLVTYNKKNAIRAMNFKDYAAQLQEGLSDTPYSTNEAEQQLLVREAKVGCANAMLQCLTPEHRLVYILGEILEFKSTEGALILESTPEAFRKNLSRTRKRLHHFLHGNCGLINPKNSCRCHKKVKYAIQKGRIRPNHLLFSTDVKNENLIASIAQLQNEVALYQSNPEYYTPKEVLTEIKRVITNTKGI